MGLPSLQNPIGPTLLKDVQSPFFHGLGAPREKKTSRSRCRAENWAFLVEIWGEYFSNRLGEVLNFGGQESLEKTIGLQKNLRVSI